MDPFIPPLAPLTEADAQAPLPRWAKALGIGHVVVATLSSLMLLTSLIWVAVALVYPEPVGDAPSVLMGMDHPRYLGLLAIDVATGLVLNGFTFASGLALINLRAWGARTWEWLAPVKIGRLILIWGSFVVFVAPPLASRVGAAVVKIMQQQNIRGARRFPSATEMGVIYAWLFLAMGIGMIVLGSIYPAATWWIVRRRGIRAALVDGAPTPAPTPSGQEFLR